MIKAKVVSLEFILQKHLKNLLILKKIIRNLMKSTLKVFNLANIQINQTISKRKIRSQV